MSRQLVVFDFDWSGPFSSLSFQTHDCTRTMADQDTDRWVFEVLAIDIRRQMEDLEKQVQWTDLVAKSLREAHARGIKREQIENTLRIIPFHPAMVRAVSKLKAGGKTTFFCLSNANSEKGLENLFDEIITNPAEWTDSGLLDLRRRIDPSGPQHNCQVGCSANMCKGEELTAFFERHLPDFDRVVYLGDGSNDFCPVLRLREQDMVLCRTFGGLHKRIAREGNLKCQVKYWTHAWEVEEIFNTL
ncbi:hypothetical protein D9758_001929 [Tetrapyrgos nigripes]|uniref:Uncharacterized protein n=1 Tax=Tetrapyrgos nigripes TaxID=182062 RepID=A0A8H5GT46_9AGAR|nr:hypothetical protein D9758_001929 [Tetrapyrgos nigripes]